MNTRQTRILEAFQRSLAVANELPDQLKLASIAPLRAELAQITARLAAHAGEQDLGLRQRTAGTRQLEALAMSLRRDYMQPIADLARKLLSPATPGLRDALAMPSYNFGLTKLVAAAAGMATAAEPYAQLFVDKGGLVPDFLQRLRAAAHEIETAAGVRSGEKGRIVQATASVKDDLRRGRDVVKLLDTLISSELREDPARLRRWKTAKRVVSFVGASGRGAVAAEPDATAAA